MTLEIKGKKVKTDFKSNLGIKTLFTYLLNFQPSHMWSLLHVRTLHSTGQSIYKPTVK